MLESQIKLPSAYQVGDVVDVNFCYDSKLRSVTVCGVSFTSYGKVLYDIAITLDPEVKEQPDKREPTEVQPYDEWYNTKIYNVDSFFLTKAKPFEVETQG